MKQFIENVTFNKVAKATNRLDNALLERDATTFPDSIIRCYPLRDRKGYYARMKKLEKKIARFESRAETMAHKARVKGFCIYVEAVRG